MAPWLSVKGLSLSDELKGGLCWGGGGTFPSHLTHSRTPAALFLRRLVSGCTFASCVFYPARPRCQLCWIFKGFCLFIPRERGGREKERERNIDQLPLVCAPTRDRTWNPGVCPDRESNLGAFGLMDDTHPTEPRRSGLLCVCWWILKPLGADGLGPPPPTCPRI